MVTIRALNTGASSRVTVSATVGPTRLSAPNSSKALQDWVANTIPEKVPVSATRTMEPTPTKSNWAKTFCSRKGGRTVHATTDTPSAASPPTVWKTPRTALPTPSTRPTSGFLFGAGSEVGGGHRAAGGILGHVAPHHTGALRSADGAEDIIGDGALQRGELVRVLHLRSLPADQHHLVTDLGPRKRR